jgi:hypothetical protein
LKARDAGGNTSTNTDALTFHTLDITAPNFDGIQGVQYSNTEATLSLFWNASSSSDLLEYRISLWKNTTTPASGAITTLTRTAASAPTGITLTPAQYPMGDNETIYAIVNACDTAAQVTEGTQNCTTYATANAKLAVLPDISPPQGFTGIKPDQITTPAQGVLGVAWNAPESWTSDYQGFKVYRLNSDNSLSLLKDCPCVAPGACTNTDTSCTVTGLDAFRTYSLLVRAYDAVGNHTPVVTSQVAYKRTTDTTLPTFASNLTVTATNPRTLSWSAATDNQYALESGAAIRYLLYQKEGATGFGTATNPSADGVLISNSTSLSFAPTGLIEGNTYHFTVCARDASLNTRCDGTVQSFLVPDSTPPTISTLTSTKTTLEQKRWNVNWTVSDNKTLAGNISIQLYRTFTDAAETPSVNPSNLVDPSEVSSNSLTNTQGPTGVMKYINYLIVATDQAGNQSSRALSVLSDNRLTVTHIARSDGPTSGGKIVLIRGTGFSFGTQNGFGTSTSVRIGNWCTSVILASPELIACTTPASPAGATDVVLTNPDGTTATLTAGYTYLSGSSYICDQDQSANQMAGGNGTTSTPYLICTAGQLNRLRDALNEGSPPAIANYRQGGFQFRIMDNINLASFNGGTFTPIGIGTTTAETFAGHINGDGGISGNRFGILNFTFSDSTRDSTGLIGFAAGNFSLRNLALINANVTGRNNTAGFLGIQNSVVGVAAQNYLSNLFLSGSITGNTPVGGIAGTTRTVLLSNAEVYGTVTGTANIVGGLIGNINGGAIINSKFTGTVSSSGAQVGGAAGSTQGAGGTYLKDSSNITVKGAISGASSIGGVFGLVSGNSGSFVDVHFDGAITATGIGNAVGGIVGQSQSASPDFYFLRCSSKGSISANGSSVGGLGGHLDTARYNTVGDTSLPMIEQSFSTMVIANTSVGRSVRVGGLVGHMGVNAVSGFTYVIKDSYFAGSISANFDFGGLIGGHRTDNDINYLIVRSYSAGALGTCSDTSSAFTSGLSGSNCGGGLVGAYYNTVGTRARGSEAIASFWDSQRGGINSTFLYNSTGGTSRFGAFARTTAQMQDQGANIYTAGTGEEVWDFNATTGVWKWPAAGGYPILRWQTE